MEKDSKIMVWMLSIYKTETDENFSTERRIDILEVDADLVANIADDAFSVCAISEIQQDQPWY